MVMVHRVGWEPGFVGKNKWLWPLAEAAELLRDRAAWPTLAELDAMYAAHTAGSGVPRLCFVQNDEVRRTRSQEPIAHERLYDGRISLLREVPTRPDNWHDLLNALCFATWPNTKLALHARQYRLLAARLPSGARRLPPARTPAQDALTLFDEGGVAVAAEPSAAAALRDADSRQPFMATLDAVVHEGRARVVPFGHALFEHLVEGIRCPGASARIVALDTLPQSNRELLQALDLALAAKLHDFEQFLRPSKNTHLRLLELGAS